LAILLFACFYETRDILKIFAGSVQHKKTAIEKAANKAHVKNRYEWPK